MQISRAVFCYGNVRIMQMTALSEGKKMEYFQTLTTARLRAMAAACGPMSSADTKLCRQNTLSKDGVFRISNIGNEPVEAL